MQITVKLSYWVPKSVGSTVDFRHFWSLEQCNNDCIWLARYHFLLVIYCILCLQLLWRCWFGGRKGIWPVKTEWWGAGVVICLERGAHWHMAQLMPLPLTVSCFSTIQIGFIFLVLAHPGTSGQRVIKRVCVCVCVCVRRQFKQDCWELQHRWLPSARACGQ